MARFIQFIPCEESEYLQKNHPSAFLLLCLIAQRARRTPDGLDGLEIGDAILGDYQSAGLTRKQYRNALETLVELGHIEIIYNGKSFQNGQQRAIKRAIKSTIVNIISTSIWNINSEDQGQQKGQQRANKGPTKGHKQERTIKNNKEKETTTPPNPQRGDRVVVLYECLKENKILTEEEKQSLSQYPEYRVKLALEFSKTEKPTQSLIQMLVWHCGSKTPPTPKKKFTEQQRMAIDFNKYLLSIGQEVLYHQNIENIESEYIVLPLFGQPMTVSLKNPIKTLIEDFKEVKFQQSKIKQKIG